MNGVRLIALLVFMTGVFLTICGGSWDPTIGNHSALICLIVGGLTTVLSGGVLALSGKSA